MLEEKEEDLVVVAVAKEPKAIRKNTNIDLTPTLDLTVTLTLTLTLTGAEDPHDDGTMREYARAEP